MDLTHNINFSGYPYTITVNKGEYAQGGTAIQLMEEDGCPFATLSVWFESSPDLPEGHFYVKDWSENEGLLESCSEFIEEVGIGIHGRVFRLRED